MARRKPEPIPTLWSGARQPVSPDIASELVDRELRRGLDRIVAEFSSAEAAAAAINRIFTEEGAAERQQDRKLGIWDTEDDHEVHSIPTSKPS
jgi:hypothetical protein